ncbi:F-box/FBD/LRR-repeat protein At4g26340-like [Silene latifolia]|uniref:F-box/FBD/LRR-repeat protein At4g26340-like n=1 Tax=Silene latifolia TaxID=37657 RepID=UPI003D789CBC
MERNERLNGLPDHLLLEILSLLPLKTAIATAVLSRRWRWMWTHLTDINIDITSYPTYTHPNSLGNVRSLVQNVLPKLASSPFIRNLSFHLRYDGFENHDQDNKGEDKYNTDNIVSWYDWASLHKNHLRKLRVLLDPHVPGMSFPVPPLWIFQTPSLEVLQLTPMWFILDNDHDHVKYRNSSFHLPNLKKLFVNLCCHDPWILEKLVSSSPSLEILYCSIISRPAVNDNPIIVNLSSRNLKRLEMQLYNPTDLVIDAPKLEYLSFHANKYGYYKMLSSYKISFVDSPTALLTCSISPWTDHHGRDIFLPSNLFTVISGVRSLTTADQNPTPFIASTITFSCLTHLLFLVRRDLNGLALLQQCPVLEVLTFDLSEYLQPTKHNWSLPDSAPQCLVTHVKRIEILAHRFVVGLEDMLLPLLSYLLGNAEVLELLKFTISPPRRDVTGYSSANYNELHLIKELFKVPRSSPQSQVEFYSPDRSVLAKKVVKDDSCQPTPNQFVINALIFGLAMGEKKGQKKQEFLWKSISILDFMPWRGLEPPRSLARGF